MILGVYVKQPAEIETLSVDWSNRILQSGYVIGSVDVKIFDQEGTEKTSEMLEGSPSAAGNSALFTVKGGTSGKKYFARIRVTLTKEGAPSLVQEEDLPIHVFQAGS